jgi:hypothetical protein
LKNIFAARLWDLISSKGAGCRASLLLWQALTATIRCSALALRGCNAQPGVVPENLKNVRLDTLAIHCLEVAGTEMALRVCIAGGDPIT